MTDDLTEITSIFFENFETFVFGGVLHYAHELAPVEHGAPCGLWGCKNGPAPFPGRMSYKATKPGVVFVLYLSMFITVLVFIRAPFMYC